MLIQSSSSSILSLNHCTFLLRSVHLVQSTFVSLECDIEKVSNAVSIYRLCLPGPNSTLGSVVNKIFWTLNSSQMNSFNVLLSSGSSGMARSTFINFMNSSFSLKLLYNPPHLNNQFGLKVKFHQFFFFFCSILSGIFIGSVSHYIRRNFSHIFIMPEGKNIILMIL